MTETELADRLRRLPVTPWRARLCLLMPAMRRAVEQNVELAYALHGGALVTLRRVDGKLVLYVWRTSAPKTETWRPAWRRECATFLRQFVCDGWIRTETSGQLSIFSEP